MLFRKLFFAGALTWMLVSLSGAALADSFYPEFMTISVEGGDSVTYSSDDFGCQAQGGGLLTCDGAGLTLATDAFSISDWDISVNEDPFVNQAFGFTNVNATAQVFTIVTTVPIIPMPGPNVMGGSAGGSVTDSNFDGLGGLEADTVSGDPFFQGLIDGVPVVGADLHPVPFSVGYAFAGETVDIPDVSFGLPGPSIPIGAAATSLGIRTRFSLSGGDSVASTNFFVVEPVMVPEPGIVLLLGVGAAMVAAGRRRR